MPDDGRCWFLLASFVFSLLGDGEGDFSQHSAVCWVLGDTRRRMMFASILQCALVLGYKIMFANICMLRC